VDNRSSSLARYWLPCSPPAGMLMLAARRYAHQPAA
jgi:hypothetical protein